MTIASYPRRLAWSLRYIGCADTALICLANLANLVSRRFRSTQWVRHFTESRFDKRFGVDTVEIVPPERLDVDEGRRKLANRYEPIPFMEFGYVIARLPIQHEDYTFVDFGSGKGRALMMATAFSFRRIIGVEISPGLHKIAQRNLGRYGDTACRHTDCQSICADATTFQLPPSPAVLFFFNPFVADTLARVLSNIEESFKREPRHMVLLYANPMHRDRLDAADWLVQTGTELNGRWLIYETRKGTLPVQSAR